MVSDRKCKNFTPFEYDKEKCMYSLAMIKTKIDMIMIIILLWQFKILPFCSLKKFDEKRKKETSGISKKNMTDRHIKSRLTTIRTHTHTQYNKEIQEQECALR